MIHNYEKPKGSIPQRLLVTFMIVLSLMLIIPVLIMFTDLWWWIVTNNQLSSINWTGEPLGFFRSLFAIFFAVMGVGFIFAFSFCN